MNRTKIEWADWTFNPLAGCYGPGGTKKTPKHCPYCYAKRISLRFRGNFDPKFYPKRLKDPYRLKKSSRIFTCSMAEPFGSWVSSDWIAKIFQVMRDNPRHIFQLLTKCPQSPLLRIWKVPDNCWLGVTVDNQDAIWRVKELKKIKVGTRFVSFEPLLSLIPKLNLSKISWIIIGAKTNPQQLPEKQWVKDLISQARQSKVKVFLKDNLQWHKKIQEFPGEM